MNVQRQFLNRRKGQVMVRTVFALGTVSAGVLAFVLSGVNRVEAVVLPTIVMGLVVFGVALYNRARSRQEWSAAWDAYADREVVRKSFDHATENEIFSWASTN